MVDATMAKRVLKELNDLQQNPAEGVRVHINEHNIAEVQAEIDGPVGPYEGGVFRMRLLLAPDYPSSPPKGFFTTKIFHPNVSAAGEICVNVLKKDWAPDMGIRHVLMVIKCLLVHPNPDSALNEEAGRLLQEDYEAFAHHARLMTSIHAQKRPGPLTATNANAQQQCGGGGAAHAADAGAGDKAATASPAAKKAKPDQGPASATTATASVAGKLASSAAGGAGAAKATSNVKKSLKRL